MDGRIDSEAVVEPVPRNGRTTRARTGVIIPDDNSGPYRMITPAQLCGPGLGDAGRLRVPSVPSDACNHPLFLYRNM